MYERSLALNDYNDRRRGVRGAAPSDIGEHDHALASDDGAPRHAGPTTPGKIGTGPYVLKNDAVPELSVNPIFSSKLARIPLISLIFGKFPWLYKSKNLEMPPHLISRNSTCSYLFLIVGGSENKAVSIPNSRAISQAMNQHLDTHNLFGSFILNYYAYFFAYDLSQKIETMREILITGLSSTKCFEIRSNDLYSYPRIVLDTINDKK